jgi:hypothetical protein
MPVIPAVGSQRLEELEFEVSLECTVRPSFKKNK